MTARPAPRPPARGADTKERILDAALQTLRTDGIVGTSARSIAAAGGFAPGVLFYHYGSVDEVLLAAVRRISAQRVERFRPELGQVTDLPGLVAVARSIHRADLDEGQVAVLAQMLAATAGNPDLGRALHGIFEPWIALVRSTLERVLADTPGADLVAPDDLAYAVTAMFIGLELLNHLGGDVDRTSQLFDAFTEMGEIAGALMALLRFGGPQPGET